MITVKEVLDIMNTGAVFSLKVPSFDRKKKKGGKIKYYPEAVLVRATPQHPKKKKRSNYQQEERIKRSPKHYKNYTRNIRILQEGHPTGQIEKIHPPLIVEFNNQTVAT